MCERAARRAAALCVLSWVWGRAGGAGLEGSRGLGEFVEALQCCYQVSRTSDLAQSGPLR